MHDLASGLKSVLRAGSCSRAASFQGRQDRSSSPGKRAMPEAGNANSAQQRATPAKRPRRDTCSATHLQRQVAGAGSAPVAKHAASAPAMQMKQEGQPTAKPVEKPALISKRTLQPADVAHLQSAQNVRCSQDTDHGLPGSGADLSGKSEQLFLVALKCLAGVERM